VCVCVCERERVPGGNDMEYKCTGRELVMGLLMWKQVFALQRRRRAVSGAEGATAPASVVRPAEYQDASHLAEPAPARSKTHSTLLCVGISFLLLFFFFFFCRVLENSDFT